MRGGDPISHGSTPVASVPVVDVDEIGFSSTFLMLTLQSFCSNHEERRVRKWKH